MKRLTMWYDGNHAICENEECSLSRCPFADPVCEQTQSIIDRLAAYEDTGLEPEEIEQLKGEVFGLRLDKQELEQYRALGPIDRLRELKQADDEGRCVVLPFKPPRWVYMCSARFPKPAKAHYASAINVLQDMDSGCVFGDTPKEAEDALRREQEKEKEDEHETS